MAQAPKTHPVERLAVKPEEAARLLDVSRGTIYNMMSRGELASFQIGRSRRIPVAAIKALLAGRAVAS